MWGVGRVGGTDFPGRASGIKGAASFIELLTWRGGKVVRVEYFRNEDEALEAAGLRE